MFYSPTSYYCNYFGQQLHLKLKFKPSFWIIIISNLLCQLYSFFIIGYLCKHLSYADDLASILTTLSDLLRHFRPRIGWNYLLNWLFPPIFLHCEFTASLHTFFIIRLRLDGYKQHYNDMKMTIVSCILIGYLWGEHW